MIHTVIIARDARRELERLSKDVARRIVARLDELQNEPRPHGSLKLTGQADLWRIRVGDYRIVYQIDDSQLLVRVLRVGHRRDAYQ